MSDVKKQSAPETHEQDILHLATGSSSSGSTSISFYIEKFPREFKKGFFHNVDRVFAAILLLSFILNVSTILLLEKFTSTEVNEKTISKIQKQYAQLLLNNKSAAVGAMNSSAVSSNYEKDVQAISDLSAYMNVFPAGVTDYLNKFSPENLPFAESSAATNAPGLSREQMVDMRQSSADRRNLARSKIIRNVEKVGLLGLISSTSRAVDQEYVQDLLEYANKNSDELQTVLSKLDRIKKPYYGNGIYQQKLALRSAGTNYKAALKGKRKGADAEVDALIRNMAPLQKAKAEVVARNIRYEKVPSSSMASVNSLSNAKLRRDAKSVVATIRSHLRSLQDCYKRELRQTPSLRGKVLARFTVDPRGAVVAAELISSSFNNSRLENCLLAKIRRWRNFPPCDPSVGNQTFRQTFKFGM
ncbi:MAG: TonB family protein [Calditrichaeota bacterium]|nr:TonB family protein [Calditrichota bacterium]